MIGLLLTWFGIYTAGVIVRNVWEWVHDESDA